MFKEKSVSGKGATLTFSGSLYAKEINWKFPNLMIHCINNMTIVILKLSLIDIKLKK